VKKEVGKTVRSITDAHESRRTEKERRTLRTEDTNAKKLRKDFFGRNERLFKKNSRLTIEDYLLTMSASRQKQRRNGATYDGQTIKKNLENSRKSMADYIYYIESSKQASDYVVVTKYLINFIQKTYIYGEDIGKALESRVPLDFATLMPILQLSTSEETSDRDRENEQFKMLY
jgi:hypothetical protein